MNTPPTPTMKAAREAEERRRSIIKLAKNTIEKEGSLEIDSDAEISEGNDNGCYVQAWAWLSFNGTEFDKEAEAQPPEKPKQIDTAKHPFKTDKTLAAVAQVTSADKTRAILNAVFIDQRQAIATDGKILLAIPYSGEILDGSLIPTAAFQKWKPWTLDEAGTFKNGDQASFPNWQGVVPNNPAPIKRALTDLEEAKIQKLAPGARRRNHSEYKAINDPLRTQPTDVVAMRVEGNLFTFSAWHLAALIRAIRAAKIKGPLTIQPTSSAYGDTDYSANPCLITSKECPALIAVIMPVRPIDNAQAI